MRGCRSAQERPPNRVSEDNLATDAPYRDCAAVGEWSRSRRCSWAGLGEAHSSSAANHRAPPACSSSGVAADGPMSRAIRHNHPLNTPLMSRCAAGMVGVSSQPRDENAIMHSTGTKGTSHLTRDVVL
jgi:hypothetical protein